MKCFCQRALSVGKICSNILLSLSTVRPACWFVGKLRLFCFLKCRLQDHSFTLLHNSYIIEMVTPSSLQLVHCAKLSPLINFESSCQIFASVCLFACAPYTSAEISCYSFPCTPCFKTAPHPSKLESSSGAETSLKVPLHLPLLPICLQIAQGRFVSFLGQGQPLFLPHLVQVKSSSPQHFGYTHSRFCIN